MPTYAYHCTNCQEETEAFQKITDAPLKKCPQCGKETLQRGPGGGIGLTFKGTGFYITDYGNKKEGCCPCGKDKGTCSTE
ncbi:MAG: zinc ribbon domain-containing protein [Chlamydiales bacterium]|nr:zinc ribbon domain-containing protein [Chlamydiia bacterium]MCP5507361.1 zinc ribbon domain-containing protein [Chlamydiales bacterium]